MHQLVEIGVARLGRVHAKGIDQVERMAGRELARRQRRAQRLGHFDAVVPAEQRRLETIEPRDLFVGAQLRAVGNIVGGTDEIVEGEHDRPVCLRDERRGDGKILVAMGLCCRL